MRIFSQLFWSLRAELPFFLFNGIMREERVNYAADVAHQQLKINPPEDTCGLVVVHGHKDPPPQSAIRY
jgi:hypothetical protein